ncbi:MAG: tRNA preQ1(34) S-adenosylmethionine ribosyltransferase-isomerase QueA [Pseudomonadota bacterium]
MQTADFFYDLPDELIAQQPLVARDASRLLVCDGSTGKLVDSSMREFDQWLSKGDLLVFNDTRVIPARLYGYKKATGGKVEVLVERVIAAGVAQCHLRASKSPPAGTVLCLGNDAFDVIVEGRVGELFVLTLLTDGSFYDLLDAHGEVPLPPYIERGANEDDKERYQTVYAAHPGAVAAPTAGLHFDESMLSRLESQGIEQAFVTLHVGAGTFQPVRVDNPSDHVMHAERIDVNADVCKRIARIKENGGRVIAVGTTVVRSLESAARSGALTPTKDETALFIRQGYQFKVVDAMLTNFHLPESTLLMLVCDFGGYDTVMNAYRHAVDHTYRFFSYGDAMLLMPSAEARP